MSLNLSDFIAPVPDTPFAEGGGVVAEPTRKRRFDEALQSAVDAMSTATGALTEPPRKRQRLSQPSSARAIAHAIVEVSKRARVRVQGAAAAHRDPMEGSRDLDQPDSHKPSPPSAPALQSPPYALHTARVPVACIPSTLSALAVSAMLASTEFNTTGRGDKQHETTNMRRRLLLGKWLDTNNLELGVPRATGLDRILRDGRGAECPVAVMGTRLLDTVEARMRRPDYKESMQKMRSTHTRQWGLLVQKRAILIPVCADESHWVLFAYTPANRTVYGFCSFDKTTAYGRYEQLIIEYVRALHQRYDWAPRVEWVHGVAKQRNSDDCGVYVIMRMALFMQSTDRALRTRLTDADTAWWRVGLAVATMDE